MTPHHSRSDLKSIMSERCHNCRRRRLRCDRSKPSCRKCTGAGEQCLGYGKHFRWNEGVASRGKMMGKSFDMPNQPQESEIKRKYRFVPSNTGRTAVSWKKSSKISIPPSLLDPLFQDLDHTSRYYVAHFANKLCRDLVTHDVANHNPYRDLVLLSKDNALLLHVMVANSAIEISNMFSRLMNSSTTKLALQLPGPVPYSLHSEKEISTRARRDALMAKQKTLQLLRYALNRADTVDWEVVLATVLLSINFELVDSGKDEWKVHVEGATRLIYHRGLQRSTPDSAMGLLRDYAVSDCLIYYILGSMFSSKSGPSAIHYTSLDVLSLLERAEANSYISCPAVLLQIMLSASSLCDSDIDTTAIYGEEPTPTDYCVRQAFDLTRSAQALDVHAWAASVQGISSRSDFESRVHVALAHKSAVCLYIHRAVPFAGLLDESSVKNHVRTITSNLSFILPRDKFLKSTSWPLFIAGAESEDPEERAWVVERLELLWETLPWGYVHTAMEMLQTIWSMKVSPGAPAETTDSWLQRIKALGNDWIVV